jgi:hypothetical protein
MADPTTVGFPRIRQKTSSGVIAATTTPSWPWVYDREQYNAVIAIVHTLASDITTPSGYTLLADGNDTTSSQRVKVYGKIADDTEDDASFTVTIASSTRTSITLLEIEGPWTGETDITTIVDFSWNGGVVTTGTTYTFDPSDTPAQDAGMIIAALIMKGGSGFSQMFSNWTDASYRFLEYTDEPASNQSGSRVAAGVAIARTNSTDVVDLDVTTAQTISSAAGCLVRINAPSGYSVHPNANSGTGTWREGGTAANNATLSDVDPDPTDASAYAANQGLDGMWSWCGAALRQTDTVAEFVFSFRGGRDNYYGTEEFRYDLRLFSATEAWTRTRDPITANIATDSPSDGFNDDAVPTPRCAHTYCGGATVYDWDRDQLLIPGAKSTNGPASNHTTNFIRMTFADNTAFPADYTDVPAAAPNHAHYVGNDRLFACADLQTSWYVFDISANTWSSAIPNRLGVNNPTEGCSCANEDYNWVLIWGNHATDVWLFDIGAQTTHIITTSGTPPTNLNDAICGGDWNSYTKEWWFWNGTGTALYRLDPITFAWSTVTIAGTQTVTPDNAEANGTFGDFRFLKPVSGLWPEGAVAKAPSGVSGSTFLFAVDPAAGGSTVRNYLTTLGCS